MDCYIVICIQNCFHYMLCPSPNNKAAYTCVMINIYISIILSVQYNLEQCLFSSRMNNVDTRAEATDVFGDVEIRPNALRWPLRHAHSDVVVPEPRRPRSMSMAEMQEKATVRLKEELSKAQGVMSGTCCNGLACGQCCIYYHTNIELYP